MEQVFEMKVKEKKKKLKDSEAEVSGVVDQRREVVLNTFGFLVRCWNIVSYYAWTLYNVGKFMISYSFLNVLRKFII